MPFPYEITILPNPNPETPLNSPGLSHAALHAKVNNTVEELQKLIAVEVVAAEDIPAFTVVRSDGYRANSNHPSSRLKVIGITMTEIQAGFAGIAIFSGRIRNSSWSWLPHQPIYLNGVVLSQVPPTTGYLLQIGKAITNIDVIIQFSTPILL